jgi:adenylate cyclase
MAGRTVAGEARSLDGADPVREKRPPEDDPDGGHHVRALRTVASVARTPVVTEPIAYTIVALIAVGMAAAFLAADPRAPTSRALSVMFLALGTVFLLNVPASEHLVFESRAPWTRLFALIEIVTIVAGEEWILRIGRTELGPGPERHRGERLLRVAQGCAVVYGLAGVLLPEQRLAVWNVRPSLALLQRPTYYVFLVPFGLSIGLATARITMLLRADLDRAERVRLVALGAATPFWCAGFFLGWRWNPLSFAIGEVVFLFGAIRYHVLQGQRGQFLARFLSPQLTQLVRERGLASVLAQRRVELSVVSCDLRGFTAFADSAAPEEVMRLLGAFYEAVGEIVNAHGGSIKDFAGDGILALVGAPLPREDHARRAVRMALAIRDRVEAILAPAAAVGQPLGIGVGVASGFATVGPIGGETRLEYAAVGPVVNLAARLCGRADAGWILVDQRTVALARAGDPSLEFEEVETAELKGLARPVVIFAVRGAAARPFQDAAGSR